MKIKQINSQNRRDFYADFECEHCGAVEYNRAGYDDSHFHQNVIPTWECKTCGGKAPTNYRPLQPKYSPYEEV